MVYTCGSILNDVVLTSKRESQSCALATWHAFAASLGNHRSCFVSNGSTPLDQDHAQKVLSTVIYSWENTTHQKSLIFGIFIRN